MVGTIRTWDILSHPLVTIRCFGWRTFFRAFFAGQGQTFLSLLTKASLFGVVPSPVPEFVERCIELEYRAKRIFAAFAKAFAETESVRAFFADLAQQEQNHADLLGVCRFAAARGRWQAIYFNPWEQLVPRLEQQMEQAEASVYSIGSVEEALRLVVEIESSEINQIFQAILQSTDVAFVKRLRPFQEAMRSHIAYVCDYIPEFVPDMMLACRELRAKFLGVG